MAQNVNQFDEFNIHEVVEVGNFDLFKHLLEEDINLIDSTDEFYGRTPLIICSFKKSDSHFKIAKYLIDCGCDVNVQANYKWNSWTALMTSCHYGNTRMVELLINANASLDLVDINSNTAWQLALENSYSDCVQIILNEMDNTKIETKQSELRAKLEKELQDAVFNNDFNETKSCLTKIAKEINIKQIINSTTSGNHTLLFRACRNGNLDIVELLINYGAIAKPHFYTKYSPLYIACHMGKNEISKIILQNFPQLIQIATIEKFLPYHAACSQGHLEILKHLIDFSLQPTFHNQNSKIMQKIYSDSNDNKYLSLFDLNSLDVNDQSALQSAVQSNRFEICQYLLNLRVKKLNEKDILEFEKTSKEQQAKLTTFSSSNKKLYSLDSTSQSFSSALLSFISSDDSYQQQENSKNNSSNNGGVSSSVSFFDQLKNVFLDTSNMNTNSKQSTENLKKNDDESNIKIFDLTNTSNEKISVYFNPINVNSYSKFGYTCLHEAIRNKNHKLISLLVNYGADVNMPIYDINSSNLDNADTSLMKELNFHNDHKNNAKYKIISNCLCEALKIFDENIFFLILDKYVYDENDFKLAIKLCLDLININNVNDEKAITPNSSQINLFGKKMMPYLLQFKISNDLDTKLNLRSKISQKIKNGLIAFGATNNDNNEILNLNFDYGIILNWSKMDCKLDKIYESWFVNATKYFKFSHQNLNLNNSQATAQNEANKIIQIKSSQSDEFSQSTSQHQQQQSTNIITVKKLYLHSITRIDLSNNDLEKIPFCLFEIESLKYMKLSFNKLKKLPTFKNEELDDVNTKITYLSSTGYPEWNCHSLEELVIDNNQLTEISLQVFKLRCLKHLNLSNNLLEKIPVEMWQAPMLFDLNLSYNKLTHLPIASCSRSTYHIRNNFVNNRTLSSRSRKLESKTKSPPDEGGSRALRQQPIQVNYHPLESPTNEEKLIIFDNKTQKNKLTTIEFEEKKIVKANFWQSSSVLSSFSSNLNDIFDNNESNEDKYNLKSIKPNNKNDFYLNNSVSKLIELNLSNNLLVKIPQCLSCLAPKLLKLNLSSNKIESLGAISDFPSGLKFLDLSNNLIKKPIRLLSESLMKFIIFYFKTQSNAVTASFEQTSYLLDLIDNLLLDNDFCYLNLLKDSLSKTGNKTNELSNLKSPRGLYSQNNSISNMNPINDDNNKNTKNNKLRSTSKRRTRSQSRNHRIMMPVGFNNNEQDLVNSIDPLTQLNTQANAINKRLLPFDLFLINFKYNKTYSNETTRTNNYDQNMINAIDAILNKTNSDIEIELIHNEKALLNSQNLQIFLEQICPHKRHIKLENLKSLNLSQNKIKKLSLMFDLAPSAIYANDSASDSSSLSSSLLLAESKNSNKNSIKDNNSNNGSIRTNIDYESSSENSLSDENYDNSSSDDEYYKGVKISSSLNNENNFVIVDAKKNTKISSKTKLKDKLSNLSPLKSSSSKKLIDDETKNNSLKNLKSSKPKPNQNVNKNEEKMNKISKLIYPNLTHLDISLNKLKILSGDLSYLENLSYLNVSSNPYLAKVSPKIGLLSKLWNLDLKNCINLTEPNMLDSLVKQKTKTSDILGFLKSILEHSRPYTRLKLMFVGVQAIGKTSLLNKLRDEGITNLRTTTWSDRSNSNYPNQISNNTNISTVGIDINEWVYEKPKLKSTSTSTSTSLSSSSIGTNHYYQQLQAVYIYQLDDAINKYLGPITYRTWDFAGQREYYSTHQYFLSKRALYLVCWKLTEEEKGINEISHWLSNIQIRAPGSPVIIVGTHQDQLAKLKNYKEISNYLQKIIYERFVRPSTETESSLAFPPIMASIEISSKTGFNVKLLARLIYDVSAQMKVPGVKDQYLLEQKIPVTYLALEESISFILHKLKQQSRNPVLNTKNYLNEIRFAIDTLYPEENNEKRKGTLNLSNQNNQKSKRILIRFRDDAEILQATQFLHENGILIHYNDAALRDLFFLDPQWLCDLLSTVITIREINPFGAKGIMKIKDLLVLFKGSRFTESEEIMNFIVDLLGKFELALTWDNYHLLIPSLLPTESMLKFSKQDIRIGIISNRKKIQVGLGKEINQNENISIISDETKNSYSNIKLVNSFSQMKLNNTNTNKINNVEHLFECRPLFNKNKQESESIDFHGYSVRRLYCMNYIPNGFFSRLITRILCDNILKDCLVELIELDYCLFDNPEIMNCFDNAELSKSLNDLIEFIGQEAEWKCWQTGIELKYLDYTLIRIKELIQDPLSINDSSSNGNNSDVYSINPLLYRDCENEFKLKTTKQISLIECYASFRDFKIIKSKSLKEKAPDSNENNDILIKILCNRQICIKIFALIIEIIDSLLEDWYPDLGTRFMQDSKGDYLVTRLAPCTDCVRLCHIMTRREEKMNQKMILSSLKESNSLFLDPFSLSSEEFTLGSRNLQSSKSAYNYETTNWCLMDVNENVKIAGLYPDEISLNADYEEEAEPINRKFSISNSTYLDQEDKVKLKQFDNINWIYCFMIDDLCHSVLKSSLLFCPKHGIQKPNILAPDLGFEDIEERFIIDTSQLKIESLLGRGSFGSVFMGSIIFGESKIQNLIRNDDKKVKVAVKVLETLANPAIDIKTKFNFNESNNFSKLIAQKSIDDNDTPLQSTPKKNIGSIKNENLENNNLKIKEIFNKNWNYRKSVQLAAKAYTIARQEIAIISSLRHENIVSMIGLSIQPLAIILELAPLGNLKDILTDYKKNMIRINPFVIQNAAKQISSALVYLHSNKIIYRDLKADNILVWKFPRIHQLTNTLTKNSSITTDNNSVFLKLADYSISRCVLPTGTKGFAGTPGFMAPEILKFNGEETYSEKVDCFSFAMLLYELISLKHPFEGQEQIKEIILNGGRPLIKSQDMLYPTLMLDLMCLCWLDNPTERPSASEIFKYTNSYEYSHLLDVTVLEDYEQKPIAVTCLNQELDENEELDEQALYEFQQKNEFMEYEEIEEEDVIDLWLIRNNAESNLSQLEILTYENKLNCTNRKLINICKGRIEAICIYNASQICCIDKNNNIYVYSCKSYSKTHQFYLDLGSMECNIVSMYQIDNTNQILVCFSNGILIIFDLSNRLNLNESSSKNTAELDYNLYDLSIKLYSTIILPTRYDKNYDLWLGGDNGEIFCFSLKSMRITATFLHSASHHYLSSTLSPNKQNEFSSFSQQSLLRDSITPSETNQSAVTLIKTSQNDTFFLWTYVYPGTTIFLWNYVSKKIMSTYNCRKALDELNFKSTTSSNREFRMIDMNFLNGHLYCALSTGTILVFKRLTLTPLFAFNAHMHQLFNIFPLTFETKTITIHNNRENINNKPSSQTTSVKKTQSLMLSIGRALAPLHEDLYLSSSKYRVDALRKYANCLILNIWNTNNE